MSEFLTVAHLRDFGEKKSLKVVINGQSIALFRDGEDIFALRDECPHKGGPLSQGWVDNGHVFCPLHGWKFELRTGECETNCDRTAQSYEVHLAGQEIQIRLPNGTSK
jgi:nitrite reductase (NADH) small subunit